MNTDMVLYLHLPDICHLRGMLSGELHRRTQRRNLRLQRGGLVGESKQAGGTVQQF